jgi:hypothetical protein
MPEREGEKKGKESTHTHKHKVMVEMKSHLVMVGLTAQKQPTVKQKQGS